MGTAGGDVAAVVSWNEPKAKFTELPALVERQP